MGISGIGVRLGRALDATQVTRDVAHMYALGTDFSLAGTQAIARSLSRDFSLSASGNGVLILSRVVKVFQTDCDAAGVPGCPNLNQTVFAQRIVVGHSSLRASNFGTPPAGYLDAQGNISSANYCGQSTLVASGFDAVLSLSQGQSAYLVEGYIFPCRSWRTSDLPGEAIMSVSCSDRRALRRGRRGFVQMFGALVLSFILIPAAGLAIDVGMMYLVQTLLSAAADGAALAGARAFSRGSDDSQQRANAEATANTYLRANFPSGYMWSTDLTVNSQAATETDHVRSLTTTTSVRLPLIFLRLFRTESTLVSTTSKATRRDANVMFVMDRSTSLQLSGSCTVLKNAAKNFVDRFAEGRDNVGLVTFGTSSRVDNALSTTFKTAIKTTLNNVSCNGATNTSQALWQAYTELVTLNQPGALNAILLFTDGLPTAATQMFAIQSASHCTDKTNKQGAAYAVSSGTNPSGLYPWIGTAQPMSSDLTLLQTPTTNNCYFRSRATDLYRDVVAVPLTDASGNSLDATGYLSVGHITGGIRLTDFNHGATNAADDAALRIRRGDPVTGGQSLPGVVIYTIGYMDVDETLLKRMANDASLSPNPVAAGTPGKYRYAGDASQLNDAFMSVASEVLRLAQ